MSKCHIQSKFSVYQINEGIKKIKVFKLNPLNFLMVGHGLWIKKTNFDTVAKKNLYHIGDKDFLN